jgi:hypothetical protein
LSSVEVWDFGSSGILASYVMINDLDLAGT